MRWFRSSRSDLQPAGIEMMWGWNPLIYPRWLRGKMCLRSKRCKVWPVLFNTSLTCDCNPYSSALYFTRKMRFREMFSELNGTVQMLAASVFKDMYIICVCHYINGIDRTCDSTRTHTHTHTHTLNCQYKTPLLENLETNADYGHGNHFTGIPQKNSRAQQQYMIGAEAMDCWCWGDSKCNVLCSVESWTSRSNFVELISWSGALWLVMEDLVQPCQESQLKQLKSDACDFLCWHFGHYVWYLVSSC